MVTRQFEGKQHASDYQKFRSGPSQEITDLIFSYMEERLSKPYGFAVDAGCGTGQNTRTLAPYFKKVLGIDISEAQIEEARKAPGSPNVTYSACPAEEVPVGDASVDLLTASIAAHWFNIEPFLKEVDRILKPGGCLAIFTFYLSIEVHYKDCTEQMTQVFAEMIDSLVPYEHEKVRHLRNGYKEMYESIPYPDKRRIENILTKTRMPIARLMGFIQTFPMFHIYLETKPEEAKEMIRTAEERCLRLMGTSSGETEVEVWLQNVLVLASKPQ
ncbi:putative methyltransferase DDB_G0268948 [Rana temporaria]|uniref:putative methyltransferase DDB_G0268948 n=1 Tax=Rana temporaria TaxID=8407 RepID=UPI001AACAC9D|nr:putative methyltransferase DDB_G0268948 [Rana temporaria]XP_040212027.1 putative methyltransferase DDB_G0268948 [Rana temporaria]XP_040212028.1 putative methyltransferase DDB_G0268948 [Rana temporaria]XP_040212029.1 putative methyltransferase DDB_G0268948 [Rana temporaria]